MHLTSQKDEIQNWLPFGHAGSCPALMLQQPCNAHLLPQLCAQLNFLFLLASTHNASQNRDLCCGEAQQLYFVDSKGKDDENFSTAMGFIYWRR